MADDVTGPQADAAQAGMQRLESLQRLAPAVQHEINNAMMVLAANLDILARTVGEAEGAPKRQLGRALQASRRMEETIRSFLDCARREAAEPARISPAEVLHQLLPLLLVALGARHGAEVVAPEGLTAVRLDRAALEMALLTVAQDATGRMPNGSQLTAEMREAAAEVELVLTLPNGIAPAPLALLRDCCTRLEQRADGCVLAWAKD